MVRWSICDCSALQSAVWLSKCLAAAPVFLLGATRQFVLLSSKICAEIVVYLKIIGSPYLKKANLN